MKLSLKLLVVVPSLALIAPLLAKEPRPAKVDPVVAEAMKSSTPGDAHKLLSPMAGRFNADVFIWTRPGEVPQEMKGTTENTWIYGGRFLKQQYIGVMNGAPFEGMGLMGYDKVRGEYQSVWVDNMTTAIRSSTGSYIASNRTITTSGKISSPMTGEKERWFGTELQFIDDNTYVYSTFAKVSEGKVFRDMQITYQRMK